MQRVSRKSWKKIVGAVGALAAVAAAVAVGAVQAAAPGAPVNSAPPIVLGSFQTGQTLTVLNGSWSASPFSYSYQWQRCTPVGPVCTDIVGAVNPTYTVVVADQADLIRVVVVATNGSGSSDPVNSNGVGPVVAAGAPVNTGAPTISGPNPPQQGQALTGQPGTWTDATTLSYSWLRCDSTGQNCAAIAAATSQTYTPVTADAGNTLRVLVDATSSSAPVGGARAVSAQTQAVPSPGPQNTAKPTITGTAAQGQTLTGSNGTWTSSNGSPISYAYQWQRCNAQGQSCVAIPGATATTYVLQQADVGSTIVFSVTATNTQGPSTAASAPTAVVTGSPAGSTIPVSQVSLPDRLVISAADYTPNVLSSRAPFTARFRVTDTQGRFVSGAEVNVIVIPYNRVAPASVVTTDQNGWATFTLRPTSQFPLIKGFVINVYVRAIKPGDNILAGVTATRLTSVRINPAG